MLVPVDPALTTGANVPSCFLIFTRSASARLPCAHMHAVGNVTALESTPSLTRFWMPSSNRCLALSSAMLIAMTTSCSNTVDGGIGAVSVMLTSVSVPSTIALTAPEMP